MFCPLPCPGLPSFHSGLLHPEEPSCCHLPAALMGPWPESLGGCPATGTSLPLLALPVPPSFQILLETGGGGLSVRGHLSVVPPSWRGWWCTGGLMRGGALCSCTEITSCILTTSLLCIGDTLLPLSLPSLAILGTSGGSSHFTAREALYEALKECLIMWLKTRASRPLGSLCCAPTSSDRWLTQHSEQALWACNICVSGSVALDKFLISL